MSPVRAGLSIRPTTYRDKPGFSVSGRNTSGRSIKIFTESRESAEHIRAKVRGGQDIIAADFKSGRNVYEITINFIMDSEQEPTVDEIRKQLSSFDAAQLSNVELIDEGESRDDRP